MMQSEDRLQVRGKSGCCLRVAVCDVGDEVYKVAEGDYSTGGGGCGGGEENIALGEVLVILHAELIIV